MAKLVIPKRHMGNNTHRLKSNPNELVMAKAWVEFIEGGQAMPERRPDALDQLLDSGFSSIHDVKPATDDDRRIAATIIQWLGSPVGSNFIETAREGFGKP